MTRAKARKLNPVGFEENGLVKVVRRIPYDKALLLKGASNVTRRRTIGLQQTPIRPILAQAPGRKSMGARVTFAPLPLPSPTPSPSPSTSTASVTPSTPGTPSTPTMARFNYGAATSTSTLPPPSPSTPTAKMMIQPKQQ